MPRENAIQPPILPAEGMLRGGTLSAGFAGVDARQATESWAEESRHVVTGPGAYEWWYFQALSPGGDGILVTLFEGLPFHPNYLTQINRHANRLPLSGKPGPALQASRYPAAYVAVYEGGKRVAQCLNLYPPDTTSSQPGVPDIRIGPNRITLRQDGSFGIIIKGYPYATGGGGRPKKQSGQLLSAKLTFTPTFMGVQHTRPFRAPDRAGAAHHWVLTAPHGRMTGEVRIDDNANAVQSLQLDIDSLGYHDHVYGEGGLSTDVDTLLWGFIQGETWTAAWHHSLVRRGLRRPGKSGRQADGLIFFEAGHPPVVIDAPDTRLSKPHLSSWLLKHPGRIAMHGSDAHGHPLELLLSHPSVLDTAPFHTRLNAEGTLSIPGRGGGAAFTGRGTTHVLKLRRLRWPILSDLTLLAITPIPRDDPIWNA